MTKKTIWFHERNIHGAVVVYGILGIRQYYYYTIKEALKLYRNEAKQKIIINQK